MVDRKISFIPAPLILARNDIRVGYSSKRGVFTT